MDLLSELMTLPTAVFTILLGLVILYWLLFLVGSLDLDVLGGADAAADGAIEGAVDGAVQGAVDGAVDGATGLLHALKLRSVPATVAITFFSFFAWLASLLGLRLFGPLLPGWLAGLFVSILALAVGVLMTSMAVRPFARLFRDHKVTRLRDLVGRVVTITTGRVDERFGQGRCDTAAALILEVRSRGPSPLTRGDAALLIDYDEETRTFVVEPADPLLVGNTDLPNAHS